MTQLPKLAYEEVIDYIRNYRNDFGDEIPYDVNGVIHLMLAALDNLREKWVDGDFEQLREPTTHEQRQMLIRIGQFLENSFLEDE